MNMLSRRITLIVLFMFSLLNVISVHAEDIDSTLKKDPHDYSLILYAGGGLSVYRGTSGVTDVVKTDLTKTGVGATLRLMWHPDHLLRFGFETGRIPFYSYTIDDGSTTGKMTVSAVPLMIAWS